MARGSYRRLTKALADAKVELSKKESDPPPTLEELISLAEACVLQLMRILVNSTYPLDPLAKFIIWLKAHVIKAKELGGSAQQFLMPVFGSSPSEADFIRFKEACEACPLPNPALKRPLEPAEQIKLKKLILTFVKLARWPSTI